VTELLDDYGLFLLFGIIAAQAAGVAGLPGKTSLVTAAILAARGHFEIELVIAVAAAAGILGGYVGYAIGRVGGRRLIERPAVQQRLGGAIALMEKLFEQHGAKAVFIARFLPGAKVVAAPAAGVADMNWLKFAFWHALGAIGFAVGFGLAGYYGGEGALELAERYGIYALVPVAVLAVVAWWGYKVLRRRRAEPEAPTRRRRPSGRAGLAGAPVCNDRSGGDFGNAAAPGHVNTGSSKKNVEPAPGREVTRTRPPIRSASSRQM
jgi:membrane-associated protein